MLTPTANAAKRSATRREGVWMHYQLSRERCDICQEMLTTLKQHASDLPEVEADRTALAVFLKNKPTTCS
jgi:ArsR family transcriptional regulator